MGPDYILIDLDDTLVDYRGAVARARRVIDAKLAGSGIDCQAFWPIYRECEADLMRRFLSGEISSNEYRTGRLHSSLSPFLKDPAGLSGEINTLYMKTANNVQLYDDAVVFLNWAVARGIGLALLTNGPSDGQRAKITATGLDNYFDERIYISEEVGSAKPTREFFTHVLDSLRIMPKLTLMVGDSPADDCAGAAGTGIPCVLVDRFDKYPSFNGLRIRSLSELKHVL